MTSQTEPSGRDKLLHAAVGLLDDQGPDALQTRKVASAAGTSTMAVYTHFGGMRGLIAAVAEEGLRQFAAALAVPLTSDPVADLVATGIAYRRYALERPHMYRLMFGSTSAHGINAPAHNLLALSVAEISDRYPSFAHLVRAVRRSMLAGRITAGSADDDAAVVAIAAQFWALIHGFVMLELAATTPPATAPSALCSPPQQRICLWRWVIHRNAWSSRSGRRRRPRLQVWVG
ncbi:bacterial regulatory s, tetR family protein [Mycobacterium xenopi 3993]|nr:bacterial regulatory s, tetR family protein [Mycobacterium xenopi 3993]